MTENQKKLINLLKEMFQFDQADLDFGIYRIMRMKREEISRFIEEDLPAQITNELHELVSISAEADITEIDNQIAEAKSLNISETAKASIIAELEAKKKTLAEKNDISSVEADVYNHLTNFFSRYYDEGDFISQRRYKDGAYAIPYEGEEVKLYWANADQYYIKTSEYFKDYTFKTAYGDTVRFKLVEAETEQDNNKANEKRFFQLHTEKPFELVDGIFTIYMEYKNGGKKNQDECIGEIVKAFSEAQARYTQFSALLATSDGKTLLERQLKRYTARNTFDYFIHKDLGKFLRRELDFYIKNDVIFLDDIDEQDEAKTKEYLTKAKVIRKIAHKIIAFLAQIENFQKKLYLKKKFVVETNYCITLDRIPEELYPEIAANDDQREEWVRLFAIDEIQGNLTQPVYSVPLTVEFLKANPYLVLDTAFFSAEFKEKLISCIDNLDEKLDGLLIHSENFQALNLLQKKYKKQINQIYIDPPYNAKSSEILYKNNYKHSSWISLMYDRLALSKHLLHPLATITVAIDENEFINLGYILGDLFNGYNSTCVTVIHNPGGIQGNNFSYTHEYAYFLFPQGGTYIGTVSRENIEATPLRDWGGDESKRETAATCFYPIIVRDGKIVEFGDVCDDDFHPPSSVIYNDDGSMIIYPIDGNGIERKWRFGRDTVETVRDELKCEKVGNEWTIRRYKSDFRFKTVWIDKKYNANTQGSSMLNKMLGGKFFDFPKSLYTVEDSILAVIPQVEKPIILDFFAGSGTTGHAIIDLAKSGKRICKYILVEMGNHFDSVIMKRIKKAIYANKWKNGKPLDNNGISYAFKYLRLESYEDTLNNIVLRGGQYDMLGSAREGYLLSYMLDAEAEGSSCLLNIDKLDKPFDYKMNITRNLESREQPVDLVETFNYLIGLTVARSYALTTFDAEFIIGEYGSVSATLKNGNTYKFKSVEGTLPNGDKALVIWREMTGDTVKDNAVLDAYFRQTFADARSYKKIFVNCDNNLQNLRTANENWRVILIDEEMKKRLFEYSE